MPTKLSSYLTELGFRQLEHVGDSINYNLQTGGEYIVIKENSRIYRYDINSNMVIDDLNVLPTSDGGNSRWIAVGGGAMTQYKINYTFESETNEIPLGMTVLSKSNIFYVNIENTQILSSEYNLNDTKDTIILSEAFPTGTRAEVAIFVGDYAPNDRDYELMTNKPLINGIELVGNKSLAQLGIQPAGDYATRTELQETAQDIDDTKADKATTLAGYGITDAYTKTEIENLIDNIDALPIQTDHAGHFLTTDGSTASWSALPIATDTTQGIIRLATDNEYAAGIATNIVPTVEQVVSAINTKQNALVFDTIPTEGSLNPVTSGGLYTAISAKANISGGNTFTGNQIVNDAELMLAVNNNVQGFIHATESDLDIVAGTSNPLLIETGPCALIRLYTTTINSERINRYSLKQPYYDDYSSIEIEDPIVSKGYLDYRLNELGIEIGEDYLTTADADTLYARLNEPNKFTQAQTLKETLNIELNDQGIGQFNYLNADSGLSEGSIQFKHIDTGNILTFTSDSGTFEIIAPENLITANNYNIPNVGYVKDYTYDKDTLNQALSSKVSNSNFITLQNQVDQNTQLINEIIYDESGKLENYVTTDTDQLITGLKAFTNGLEANYIGKVSDSGNTNNIIYFNNDNLNINTTTNLEDTTYTTDITAETDTIQDESGENINAASISISTGIINQDTSNINELRIYSLEDGTAKAELVGTAINNIPDDSDDGTLVTTHYLNSKINNVPENVVVSHNYINAGLWKGTLNEYNALGEYDDNITYIITDDNDTSGGGGSGGGTELITDTEYEGLNTTNKTIEGAINELNSDITSIESQLENISGIKKEVYQNPVLTVNENKATWTIAHTIENDDISVTLKEIATGELITAKIIEGTGNITIEFNATSEIAANTYKAILIG